MRIVEFITRSDTIGGAQVHVRDLSLSLQQRGHDVTVFVGGTGPFTEDLSRCGVAFTPLTHLVRAIHPLKDARALVELMKRLKAHRPELLATHSGKAGWLGRLAGRLLGIPTVFTAHGWTFASAATPMGRAVYRGIENLTAHLADRVIAVSHCDRQLALDYGVVPADRLSVVHNGVPDFAPDSRLFADAAAAPPRLISVARLQEPKDFDTLLDALNRIRDLDWQLDLVGDGPLEAHVAEQVEALDLQDRVWLLGLRTDVPELVSRAQVAVLVSKKEGLPLSLLEAMRAALPVVASDVGGVAEAVQDGVTGLLAPSEDAAALALQLRRVVESAALRQSLGEAGRARFTTGFTVDRMVDETERIYHEVVSARAAA